MDRPWAHVGEQRLVGHSVIRTIIVRRNAALVAEPHRRMLPDLGALGRLLVGGSRRAAAGKHDLAARSGGLQEQVCTRRGRVVDDLEAGAHALNLRAAASEGP